VNIITGYKGDYPSRWKLSVPYSANKREIVRSWYKYLQFDFAEMGGGRKKTERVTSDMGHGLVGP